MLRRVRFARAHGFNVLRKELRKDLDSNCENEKKYSKRQNQRTYERHQESLANITPSSWRASLQKSE